ncbi:MAG: pilus assembly protein [Chloroflexi bacterium]|nr:pilus assembly protein [Chloroflexota bacterium]
MTTPGRGRRAAVLSGSERGQAMVEAALAFPLLLLVAIGLVQFALFYHAQNVVTGAVQDGARVAAAEDRTLEEGIAHANALLRAGLGRSAGEVTVGGIDGGDAIAVEARGRLRTIIPWVADATLPLWARSVASKERFRAGPGG